MAYSSLGSLQTLQDSVAMDLTEGDSDAAKRIYVWRCVVLQPQELDVDDIKRVVAAAAQKQDWNFDARGATVVFSEKLPVINQAGTMMWVVFTFGGAKPAFTLAPNSAQSIAEAVKSKTNLTVFGAEWLYFDTPAAAVEFWKSQPILLQHGQASSSSDNPSKVVPSEAFGFGAGIFRGIPDQPDKLVRICPAGTTYDLASGACLQPGSGGGLTPTGPGKLSSIFQKVDLKTVGIAAGGIAAALVLRHVLRSKS